MQKTKLLFICLYNNQDIFNNMLYKSLNKINLNNFKYLIDFKFINNINNEFKSATSAYNQVVKSNLYDIYFFIHQDISFQDTSTIYQIIEFLVSNPYSIAGVAGSLNKIVYSTIKHGKNYDLSGKDFDNLLKVQTLDECFFAVTKEVFSKLLFDEKTFDGWHLFLSDFCLSANTMNIDSFVFKCDFYHLSKGIVDNNYFFYLFKLISKHRNIAVITTSCAYSNQSNFLNLPLLLVKYLRSLFKKALNLIFKGD